MRLYVNIFTSINSSSNDNNNNNNNNYCYYYYYLQLGSIDPKG